MIFSIADKQTNLSSLIFGGELHIHIHNKRISETPFLLISPILLNCGSQIISRAWWNEKLRRGIHNEYLWSLSLSNRLFLRIPYLPRPSEAQHEKGSPLFLYSTKKNPATWIRTLILLLNNNNKEYTNTRSSKSWDGNSYTFSSIWLLVLF